MKENGFILKKVRNRRYLTQTITDADYADGIALLVNTSTQVEFPLSILDQAGGGIGLHVNADKAEHMCFNKKRRHLYSKYILYIYAYIQLQTYPICHRYAHVLYIYIYI